MSQIYNPSSGGGGSGEITLQGNTGGSLGPASSFTILTNNTNVVFAGLGTILTQDFGLTTNLLLGTGTFGAATNCTGFGKNALLGVSGVSNSGFGFEALQNSCSGNANMAFGDQALRNLASGSTNVAIGYTAGLNYTGSESNNILINNSGTSGDNSTTRIGNGSTAECYIDGIAGVSVSNLEFVTIDTTTGQLGSTSGSLFTLKSSLVDMTSGTVQALLTSPSSGSFVVTSIVEYGQNVTGVISPATFSIGWTAPNYDDLSTGGTQVDTTGTFSTAFAGGGSLPFVIPASTSVSINVTVAGTATTFDEYFYLSGFILF